jgi:hypothetical protein
MKDELPHHMHNHRKGKKDERQQLAAELAPLEEQDQAAAQKQLGGKDLGNDAKQTGAIVIDNSDLHLPKGVMEGSSDEKRFLGIEPVVLVIVGAMLLYIAFIVWKISLMPPESIK